MLQDVLERLNALRQSAGRFFRHGENRMAGDKGSRSSNTLPPPRVWWVLLRTLLFTMRGCDVPLGKDSLVAAGTDNEEVALRVLKSTTKDVHFLTGTVGHTMRLYSTVLQYCQKSGVTIIARKRDRN